MTIVWLGAACAGQPGQSDHDGEPPIDSWLTVVDTRTLTLPLDQYSLSDDPYVRKAENALVYRCLGRFGFTVEPLPEHEPVLEGNQRKFGLDDENLAQTRGYHTPVAPAETDAKSIQDVLPPAGLAVLRGVGEQTHAGLRVPEGGCVGEARRRLNEGAPDGNDQLVNDLRLDAALRAERDSRMVAAFAEWSSCMTRSGYDYDNPHRAMNDPEWATEQPTPNEIAVAVADVGCAKKVNLVSRYATVVTAYHKRAIENNAEALQAVKDEQEARKRNAATVLAGE